MTRIVNVYYVEANSMKKVTGNTETIIKFFSNGFNSAISVVNASPSIKNELKGANIKTKNQLASALDNNKRVCNTIPAYMW